MVQCGSRCLGHDIPYRSASGCLAPLLPIQHSAYASQEAADDGSSTWVPATLVTKPNGILGSWLPSGLSSGSCHHLRMNQRVEDLFYLCYSAFQIIHMIIYKGKRSLGGL